MRCLLAWSRLWLALRAFIKSFCLFCFTDGCLPIFIPKTSLWNYNPYNDDQAGDHWNGENFSWFSRRRALPPSLLYYEQDAPSLDNGGRILSSVVRPYAAKTAGIPLRFEYEMNTGAFTYEWANPFSGDAKSPSTTSTTTTDKKSISDPPLTLHRPLLSRETEIFIPSQLTHGRNLIVQGLAQGDKYFYDERRQTLFIVTQNMEPGKVHRVTVSVDPMPRVVFYVNDIWTDFGGHIMSVGMLFFAVLAYWVFDRLMSVAK